LIYTISPGPTELNDDAAKPIVLQAVASVKSDQRQAEFAGTGSNQGVVALSGKLIVLGWAQ